MQIIDEWRARYRGYRHGYKPIQSFILAFTTLQWFGFAIVVSIAFTYTLYWLLSWSFS